MKRKFFFVFVLALLLSNQVASQTQIQRTLQFTIDNLSFNTVVSDSLTFTKVSYADLQEKICDTGLPELPVLY